MILENLTISQVQRVIELARDLNVRERPHRSGWDPSKDGALDVLEAAFTQSPEELALHHFLEDLSHDAFMELHAVMWLGRRDFERGYSDPDDIEDEDAEPEDLASLVQQAHDASDSGDVLYFAEKAGSLPAYLSRGLAKLKPGQIR